MKELWMPNKSLHLPSPTSTELNNAVKESFLIGGFIELGVWNKSKEIIHQEREVLHSPTQQFLELLLAQIKQRNVATVVDTGGIERSVGEGAQNLKSYGPANQSLYGIVVGTGNTAVDITDNKLVAQIAHGTSAGQFIHNLTYMAFTTVTVSDPNCYFEPYRNFNNNSGGSITVQETGIYCLGTASYYFCIYRDVPTQIVVPDGGGCYIKYTLNITE